MKKEIKDYIHFYLPTKQCDTDSGGCINSLICNQNDRCQRPSSISVFIFPDDSLEDGFLKKYLTQFPKGVYNPQLTHENYKKFLKDGYKLILRPLSDILNTEAYEVYKIYFDKEMALDFSGDTGSAYFNPKQVRVKAEHALRIFNGEDYETGDFMKVLQLVPYLLKQGFDIFGLIEAGVAIDKTKIAEAIK